MSLIRIIISIYIMFSLPYAIPCDEKGRLGAVEAIPVTKAPYVVIVLCSNSKYYCTGAVLNEEWVLTSAQCLYSTTGTYTEGNTTVFVVAGTNQLKHAAKDIANGEAQIRQSKAVFVYNLYTFTEKFKNDLALINLNIPLIMTNRTQKAPLIPRRFGKKFGDHYKRRGFTLFVCTAFGFGKVYQDEDNNLDGSLKMQKYNLSRSCSCLRRVWSYFTHSNVLKDNTFLCEEDTSWSGLCSGDQGSPVICEDFLRGIGSTGFHYTNDDDCHLTKKPGPCASLQSMHVFTELCAYSSWLNFYIQDYPIVDEMCEPFMDVTV